MTRLEAEDRAQKLWGSEAKVQYAGLTMDPRYIERHNLAEWYVHVPEEQYAHTLDSHGHANCHEVCSQKEMSL